MPTWGIPGDQAAIVVEWPETLLPEALVAEIVHTLRLYQGATGPSYYQPDVTTALPAAGNFSPSGPSDGEEGETVAHPVRGEGAEGADRAGAPDAAPPDGAEDRRAATRARPQSGATRAAPKAPPGAEGAGPPKPYRSGAPVLIAPVAAGSRTMRVAPLTGKSTGKGFG